MNTRPAPVTWLLAALLPGGSVAAVQEPAPFVLPASVHDPAGRSALVRELRLLMIEGIGRTEPHYDRQAGLETAFTGSYDHHSCVIAHWALLVLARIEGDAALRETLLGRLDRGRALAGELALLEVENLLFRPYDEAWLLMLAAELARHEGVDADAVERFRRTLEARLLEHLRAARFPESSGRLKGRGAFSGSYNSWLFTFLLLTWSEPVTEGLPAGLEALRCERLEPHREALLAQDRTHPFDFLSVHAILALLDRARGAPLEESPYATPDFPPLPASVERNTVHVVGLELSRVWPLAADAHVGDDDAGAAYEGRLLEILRRPDLWREDFEIVTHWVPQFVFIGLWLREGRP